jgi:YD repeat-containing protein
MFRLALAILCTLAAASLGAFAQQDSGDVRVSVVLNADGSRTVYENDAANHKTVATTKGKDGKLREKIRWDLDENGRFLHGEVFGPKEQFRFILQNKYDANNRLIEETHFGKDQSVIGKIVFRYDAAGHQIGYSTYDGAGKLLGQTAAATASPAKRK